MSDSITVEITVPATRFPQFVATLADLLEEPERSVLAGVDCADPSRFARSIAPLRGDRPDGAAICLTFAFAGDPVLLAFRDVHPDIRSTRPGTVPVGCFWSGFVSGPESVVASFTSATRSIADVVRESPSVRDTLRRLAHVADATSAVLIDEWGDSTAL
jgi:hypothetical protein